MEALQVTDRLYRLLATSDHGLAVDEDGDAYVEDEHGRRCHIVVAGEEHPHVVVFTVAATGLTPSPELFRWVATRADTTLCQIGAYVDNETGLVSVSVRETLFGDTVDATDLDFALVSVFYVAAELASEIRTTFLPRQR